MQGCRLDMGGWGGRGGGANDIHTREPLTVEVDYVVRDSHSLSV